MEQYEFHGLTLRWLAAGPVVCGRCGDAGFGVGDVFAELHRYRYERAGPGRSSECVEITPEAEVALGVAGIEAYGRPIDRLHPGGTAAVRLDGAGLDRLAGIDFAADARAGRHWSLWGHRPGERVPNCGTFAYPQPGTIAPGWLTSTVVSLAEAIHAGCAFDRMPILADALEDAGCDDPAILNHCRGPGPHSRACHVLRRIRGRP